jgi:hypothetical protein
MGVHDLEGSAGLGRGAASGFEVDRLRGCLVWGPLGLGAVGLAGR